MSTHTEYTVQARATKKGDRHLRTDGHVVTADEERLVGLTRPVIVSEREVEDPEPEHPTAQIIRITAVSDRVSTRCVGRVALREPQDGTYRVDLGDRLAWISSENIEGWEDVTPVPTRLVADYVDADCGQSTVTARAIADAAVAAQDGGEVA